MSGWRKTHENELRARCLERAGDRHHDLVLRAFGNLESLFTAAARGHFRFAPAADIADRIETENLLLALNLPRRPSHPAVKKLIVIPRGQLNELLPHTEWMTQEECRTAVLDHMVGRWSSLARCLGETLWRERDTQRDVHDQVFEGDLAPLKTELREFDHALSEAVNETLWQMIPRSRHNGYFGDLWRYIGNALDETVLLYLHAAVSGQDAHVCAMSPLVRHLSRCLPLGGKKGQPDTWIVLAA